MFGRRKMLNAFNASNYFYTRLCHAKGNRQAHLHERYAPKAMESASWLRADATLCWYASYVYGGV